jgi:outer membrane lipoprotein-sorting protein
MIRKLWLAALIVPAFFCAAASAQTADDVIQKNIAARGGLDKIKAINSIRMSGKALVGPGIPAPITISVARPGHLRFELQVQGKSFIQAYDGAEGWTVNPFSGSSDAQKMSADELKEVQDQADMLEGPLVDYKTKGHAVELLGKEDFEGTEVYKLKLTKKNGDIAYIFIDASSHLELKETGKRKTPDGNEIEVESIAGDYKAVGGVLFAHSIEAKANGQTQFQATFDKVEINPTIEASFFKMPAAAPAPAAPAAKP